MKRRTPYPPLLRLIQNSRQTLKNKGKLEIQELLCDQSNELLVNYKGKRIVRLTLKSCIRQR